MTIALLLLPILLPLPLLLLSILEHQNANHILLTAQPCGCAQNSAAESLPLARAEC